MSPILSFHPPPSQPVTRGSNIGEAQLRSDNNAIFVAASAAQKAVEYLDGLQPARPEARPIIAGETLDAA